MSGVLGNAQILGLAERLLPGQETVAVYPVVTTSGSTTTRTLGVATACVKARVESLDLERMMHFGIAGAPDEAREFTFWTQEINAYSDVAWDEDDWPVIESVIVVSFSTGKVEEYIVKGGEKFGTGLLYTAIGVRQSRGD